MRYATFTLMTAASMCCSAQRLVPVGAGISGQWVAKLLEYNGQLVIGGSFSGFNGYQRRNIMAWDGANGYSPMGGAFNTTGAWVEDMIVHQGNLIVAGRNYSNIDSVMQWNGTSWTMLGAPFDNMIRTFASFNGDVVAGGRFTSPHAHVARWDGTQWLPMDAGLNGEVNALCVHNGELYAGGVFTSELGGGQPVSRLARWSGTSWVQVLDGLNNSVTALMSTPQGLWIGGSFTSSGIGTVTLPGSAQYDGNSFLPLIPESVGPNIHFLQSPGFGLGVSATNGLWVANGGTFDKMVGYSGWRSVADLSGQILAAGQFGHNSYWTVAMIGRWTAGTDVVGMEVSGIFATVEPSNNLFNRRFAGRAGFEVPAGSGLHTIFSSSICAAAVSGGNLHAIPIPLQIQEYRKPEAGPWCTDTSMEFQERYHQVWLLDKGMIWQHATHWNDPGYIAPHAIADWPGNGNTNNGEPTRLAPFNDQNGDGTYAPQTGEVPLFRGDVNAQIVLSDQGVEGWNGGDPIGMDIHVSVHGVNDPPGDTLHQVLFVSYLLINRSADLYDTLWVGSHVDTDIGNVHDDYVGCDTILRMGYGYNGDANDENTSAGPGYGAHPPAQGVVALNADLHAFEYQPGATVNWGSAQSYYNMLRGRYPDGSPIFSLDSSITRYMVPADPWDPVGWNEINSWNQPNDRRMLASYGPYYNVAPGDTICLDLAFVFAQDTTGDNLSSVALLKQRAQAVRYWYDHQPYVCGQYPVLGIAQAMNEPVAFTLFPNPAGTSVTLTTDHHGAATIALYSATGQCVRTWHGGVGRMELALAGIAPGLYVLELSSEKGASRRKLIVR